MSEGQSTPLRKQVGDSVVDMRNEAIVQATNAFLFGRQIVLTGVGLTFLGVDQVSALLRQAVERGEVAESDAQRQVDALRQKVADGTTSKLSSHVAALLNHVPGVRVTYSGPAATEESTNDAGPQASQDQG